MGAGLTTGATVSAIGAMFTASTGAGLCSTGSGVSRNTDGCSVTTGTTSAIGSMRGCSTNTGTSAVASTRATGDSMTDSNFGVRSTGVGSATADFSAKMDRLSSSSVLDEISIASGVVSAAIGVGTNSGCTGSGVWASTGADVKDFSVKGVGISLSLKSISCNSEEFDWLTKRLDGSCETIS